MLRKTSGGGCKGVGHNATAEGMTSLATLVSVSSVSLFLQSAKGIRQVRVGDPVRWAPF